ncbi:hypothetical protein EVAR_14989_1 [Eumeta japonica]|uniref:Uncharacterized protein n=1 Tax=Eumeta variegata TaxID=151549 RepID=A0A4C1X5G2_EUMVA|nr:hypothetical protein EVAR_14989_1 [Eumeta japonica]
MPANLDFLVLILNFTIAGDTRAGPAPPPPARPPTLIKNGTARRLQPSPLCARKKPAEAGAALTRLGFRSDEMKRISLLHAARGRPIIVEWERDARHSAGLSRSVDGNSMTKQHLQTEWRFSIRPLSPQVTSHGQWSSANSISHSARGPQFRSAPFILIKSKNKKKRGTCRSVWCPATKGPPSPTREPDTGRALPPRIGFAKAAPPSPNYF